MAGLFCGYMSSTANVVVEISTEHEIIFVHTNTSILEYVCLLPQILMSVLMVLLAVNTHVLTMLEATTAAATLDTRSMLT